MDPIFRQTHLLLNQVNLGYILACSEVYQKGMLFLFGEQHIFFSGRLLIFVFWARFWIFFWVPGSLLSLLLCFSASLLFCFLLFLPLCFSAFLLFAFPASLLFCFSLLSLRLCFSAFVLLCLSPSTLLFYFFFLSHVCLLLYLLPAPLLLCFLS